MCSRLSDKHLVYRLASVFAMVSSVAFSVSMFICSLHVADPFFICRSVAFTSYDVISGTSFGTVWITVLCSLLHISMYSSIRSMILSHRKVN